MPHTPGPWDVADRKSWSEVRVGSIILANVYGDSVNRNAKVSLVTCRANTRLMAAAPELLAALRVVLDRYVGLVNSGDAGDWDPESEEQVQQARAAIAKAEGREVSHPAL